ncbi:hypothetical protein [Micromonospora sonneratiae]|uniref:Uncharacterized protein n=1 Tax=Micromonospora sonneratiae TaxID=1184706 RepID=A0ABW3YE40_9ACTN
MTSALVALLVGQAATVPASASSESLDPCSWESHCYATLRWYHDDVSGAEVELGAYVMDIVGPGPHFETSEVWIGFDGSPISWVEAGVIHGVDTYCGGVNYFSAASYPAIGFEFRCLGSAPLNTSVVLRAEEGASGTWSWTLDGAALTTWLNAPTSTNFLEVGNEYTRDDVQSIMAGSNLKYRTATGGVWTNGWSATGWPAPAANPSGWPCYTLWQTNPTHMRALCNTISLTGAQAGPTGRQSATDPLARAQRIATSYGVTNPTQVRSVTARGADVAATLQTDLPEERAVTVVQMSGDFTATSAPRPQGASAPSGKVLTMVFDQLTGDLRMLRLSPDGAPALEALS